MYIVSIPVFPKVRQLFTILIRTVIIVIIYNNVICFMLKDNYISITNFKANYVSSLHFFTVILLLTSEIVLLYHVVEHSLGYNRHHDNK